MPPSSAAPPVTDGNMAGRSASLHKPSPDGLCNNDLVRPDWLVGSVYGCGLRDKLVARALAGDRDAVRQLIAAVPRDMPPAVRRGARDAEIRRLAAEFRAARPALSGRATARLLERLGQHVEVGHSSLPAAEFPWLSLDEGRALVERVREILASAPGWPGWLQIWRIAQ